MSKESKTIPRPVVLRLPQYLTYARGQAREGREWISSSDLAGALGLTSSTVRQDLSHLDLNGISKRGYRAREMEDAVRLTLGGDIFHRLVIVGAGHLGCALALHGELAENGFRSCGLFDRDAERVGQRFGRFVVRPMKDLKAIVDERDVGMGVIAVPSQAAQGVAEHLMDAGVTGLLNLAYAAVKGRPGVSVVNAHILSGLQELAYIMRNPKED